MKKKRLPTDQEAFAEYQAAIMAAVSEYCRRMGMPAVAQSINEQQQHPRFHEALAVFQGQKDGT